MNSIVSEKDQVTIPKKVRDHLGLKPGVSISFESVAGTLVGKKTVNEEPLFKWIGKGRFPNRRTRSNPRRPTPHP
jgi:AbrB family looped-hinge helix DNA binding protein